MVITDLIVVGNGLAAQTFLFELFNAKKKFDEMKSQNFSVAQIYADEISPPCSLNSTATVSLSGIEEGISPLGDELRTSYFLFEEFYKKHNPAGIEPVRQQILSSTPEEKEKMQRRYQFLFPLKKDLLKKEMSGVELDSYQISPGLYSDWMNDFLNKQNLRRVKNFVRSIDKNVEGDFIVELLSGEKLVTRKIVLATGGYSKIYSRFFNAEAMPETQIVSGSYLERRVDLNRPSFFLTIDGHNCVYRSSDKTLVIGSVSQKGAFSLGNIEELKKILKLFSDHLSVDPGQFEDFKIKTGLRHKGRQRRPIFKALDSEKKIYLISGFYKNGFTFAHLAAREVLRELNL